MQFDNPYLIESAKTTTVREVEVLYWMVEDAFFAGKIDKAKTILEMLAYIAKFNITILKTGLHDIQRKRLKQLCFETNGMDYSTDQKAIEIQSAVGPKMLPFTKEAELRDYLYDHKAVLEQMLKTSLHMFGKEIEVTDGYKCDIVAETQAMLFPIELKIVQANHRVCSQIDKYCFYFYRQMRYDRFKNIQGVVIASGFDSWSINELRRRGHIIGEIVPQENGEISLRQLGR